MIIETIAIIFFLLAIFFMVVEIKKMNKIKKPSQSFGNGQCIGEMENQNDYFSITEISDYESLLVLVDGTSLRVNIRQSAIMASNIIKELYIKNRNLHTFKDILKYSLLEVEDKNKQFVFENRIALSILSVQIKGSLLSYGQIGTCSLLVYRNGEITNITDVNEISEKYRELNLIEKDKVLMLSKGAFMSLTETEIIRELESEKGTNDKATSLINTIKRKHYKYQENATVLIVEIEKI